MPVAINGILDLRNWNFDSKGPLYLSGEWAFYQDKFYTNSSFGNDTNLIPEFININLMGTNQEKYSNIPVNGYGTYRLIILLPRQVSEYRLRSRYIANAYRIYLNDDLFAVSGQPGNCKSNEKSDWDPMFSNTFSAKDKMEMIIQISCFHHEGCGIVEPVMIGNATDIRKIHDFAVSVQMFVCGSFFIIGLYHLILFILYRKDRSPLYFGLLILITAVYYLFSGEKLIENLVPGISFSIFSKILCLINYFQVILYYHYIYILFPKETPKIPLRIISLFYLTLVFVTLISKIETLMVIASYVYFSMLIAAILSMVPIIWACFNKRFEAVISLVGLIILIGLSLIDEATSNTITRPFHWTTTGLYLLVLIHAFILSRRLTKAFKRSETLAGELSFVNINLERLVKDKTKELEVTNKNLENRIKNALEKQKEQQQIIVHQSSLTALGELAAGIAHEINQPMQSISFAQENIFFETMEPSPKKSFIQGKTKIIGENIGKIRRIIDHIRIFSSRQKDEISEAFNINECIRNGLSMVKNQFKNRNILIDLDLNKEVPMVVGNPYRFEQVVINLLTNARDALDEMARKSEGEYVKKVLIRTLHTAEEVIIEIVDNGTGIPADRVTSIFLPFYSTKRPGAGTGLGLSISMGIIKEMEGNIMANTQEGKGTKIIINLPIKNINNDT